MYQSFLMYYFTSSYNICLQAYHMYVVRQPWSLLRQTNSCLGQIVQWHIRGALNAKSARVPAARLDRWPFISRTRARNGTNSWMCIN